MHKKLDKGITLRGLEPIRGSERAAQRIARSVAIVLGIALFAPMAHANTGSIEQFKYDPKRYINATMSKQEARCLRLLIGKESAWNYKAVGNLTGTHKVYGIPQGKSEWLRTANPYQQIDWGLRYIGHRYGYTKTHEGMQPNTCKALDHWKRKGWH